MTAHKDFNVILRETRTAPEADPLGLPPLEKVDPWKHQQKDGRSRNRVGHSHFSFERELYDTNDINRADFGASAKFSQTTGIPKDFEWNKSFSRASVALSSVRNSGMETSLEAESSGTVMAHFVLEYVFTHELGGRINGSRGDEDACCPPPGRIAAERAQLRPPGKNYLAYCFASSTGPSELLNQEDYFRVPRMVRTALPDNLFRYRQSLAVCDFFRDTLGGITGPCAPSLRKRDASLLEEGLQGKQWTGNHGNNAEDSSDEMKMLREKKIGFSLSSPCLPVHQTVQSSASPPSLHLFETEEPGSVLGMSGANAKEEAEDFSLDAYLNGSDSDE